MLALLLLSLTLWPQAVNSASDQQVPLVDERVKPTKRISFQDVLSGDLRPASSTLQWTSTGRDGSYFETNQTTNDLWLAHVLDKDRELLVNGTQLHVLLEQTTNSKNIGIHEYKLQPGDRDVLVGVNYTKLYRYSGFADYYIFNPSSGTLDSLDTEQAGDIRYATWSPTGDSIAYVRGNDLYVYKNGTKTRVTFDGSEDLFNGVPDWVYEEEIFTSTNTLWYSPDGRFIASLKFNETGVPTYRVPYYMTGQKTTAYPRELELRYPKAGQVIPSVSLHLVDLKNLDKGSEQLEFDSFGGNDFLIGEVSWITDGHSHLAWRAFNRNQDHDKLLVLDIATRSISVATERIEKHGWIDNFQSVRYVPRLNCYVYLSDEDGYSHIYLQYVNGSKPLQITSGEWEVTEILHVSSDKVVYQSTERDSTERHIYSIDLEFMKKEALVDDNQPGYYSASFSSEGEYYILSYKGPGFPRQELYSINDSSTAIRTLEDNSALAEKLSQYNLPASRWTTIEHPDGFDLNVLETVPPDFDSTKKYPLLLNPYGGPWSQETSKSFRGVDWWAYAASDPALEYVILTVDGRGTGYKGKEFRSVITGNLGHYEALDQVFAAQYWSNKSYIDGNKIVIQGWSYGGYLSGKVIELGTDVFSSAIITAPVSSWEFYDAFYTERYMKFPLDNAGGYYESSIHNTSGFSSARGGVLLQHGTGDDNVHFQNSAVLLDLLMTGGVAKSDSNSTTSMTKLSLDENIVGGKFSESCLVQKDGITFPANTDESKTLAQDAQEFSTGQKPVSPSKLTAQWFTDSDHRIEFHGSTLFLRKQMAQWLYKEKRRREPRDMSDADKEASQWLADL